MKAKKSFGQHFLKENSIAQRIAESMKGLGTLYHQVLEVGPGRGMLTQFLLELPLIDLKVVEADEDMVMYLRKNYPSLEGRIIANDFLKEDLSRCFPNEFGLIGNFPYNISSQIVFKMIDYRTIIPEMVGMFQREVAVRIAASPKDGGEYGIISILTQAYYKATLLFSVKPGSFNPPPKVNSAVIRLTRYRTSLDCDEVLFKKIVKTAFNQRRKMLRNTLREFFPEEILHTEKFFEQRPENLSVEDFIALAVRSKTLMS